jgi:hypothetical protein
MQAFFFKKYKHKISDSFTQKRKRSENRGDCDSEMNNNKSFIATRLAKCKNPLDT